MTFLIIGLTCAAFVSALASSLSWPLKAVATMLAAAALALVLYLHAGVTTLGGQEWLERSPWWELLLFVVMLLGMVCRYMTAAIEERRSRLRAGESRRRARIKLDAWEFSYPLFVSVITFGGVLSAISTEGFKLTNVIISFQTGFFWQTLLSARTPAAESVKTLAPGGAKDTGI
jgi:hypothetical protein